MPPRIKAIIGFSDLVVTFCSRLSQGTAHA